MNEIAQSEAVTGKPLALTWLHNGMVMVNGEKMFQVLWAIPLPSGVTRSA